MNIFKSILIYLVIVFDSSAFALTLHDAYDSALVYRPTQKIAKIDISISKEKRSQAWAEFYPSVSLKRDDDWYDSVSSSIATNRHQSTTRANISQPLYQGGGEYAGLRIAKRNVLVAEENLKDINLNIFREVASRFIDLLSLDTEIKTLDDQTKLLSERIGLLRSRAKIGRSKLSELVAAESQLARVMAEKLKALSQKKVIEGEFLWLTGKEPTQLEEPVAIGSIEPNKISEISIGQVPEIVLQKRQLENAEDGIDVIKSDFWPELDLSANYYLNREGFLSTSDWDVSLSFSWELFSGMSTRSAVGVKKLIVDQEKLKLDDLSNRKKMELQTKKQKLTLLLKTIDALKKAQELAEKSYLEQQREFEKGLVSNLEVIRSLDDYLQARRTYDNQRYEAQFAWIELKLLVGVIK